MVKNSLKKFEKKLEILNVLCYYIEVPTKETRWV